MIGNIICQKGQSDTLRNSPHFLRMIFAWSRTFFEFKLFKYLCSFYSSPVLSAKPQTGSTNRRKRTLGSGAAVSLFQKSGVIKPTPWTSGTRNGSRILKCRSFFLLWQLPTRQCVRFLIDGSFERSPSLEGSAPLNAKIASTVAPCIRQSLTSLAT
jgi:hypothetical protein